MGPVVAYASIVTYTSNYTFSLYSIYSNLTFLCNPSLHVGLRGQLWGQSWRILGQSDERPANIALPTNVKLLCYRYFQGNIRDAEMQSGMSDSQTTSALQKLAKQNPENRHQERIDSKTSDSLASI